MLVDKSIEFMWREKAWVSFLSTFRLNGTLPKPTLPTVQRKITDQGTTGDKLMEGEAVSIGQILDTLKQLGIEDNASVFASDNGPQRQTAREHGNQGTPDMGNSGPFRGELGEATEGAIRTAEIIRWPGKVKANTTTYAMFSIMDFLPTFAHIIGGKMPTDRTIDGINQAESAARQRCWTSRKPFELPSVPISSPRAGSSGVSTSRTSIQPAWDLSDSRMFSASAPIAVTRRSTTLRWILTRTSSSRQCWLGLRTRRSKAVRRIFSDAQEVSKSTLAEHNATS